ncbi:unnamed protein product [Moneuplotes crassus]|uniref:TRP C-terminal domain-containing protein n=1 Tax=Euplotes crassus TaxID=5936 RepID=A0AAD1X8W9_EUPCR|nr:unnamed protein product [Moneuplotes crassus]
MIAAIATTLITVILLFMVKVSANWTDSAQTFEPQLKTWSVGSGSSCQIKQLIMSTKEDAIFGSGVCNSRNSVTQIFKRNFDLSNVWNIFIDAEPDYNGFTIDQSETSGFLVSEDTIETRLVKLNLTAGSTLEFKRYTNIMKANSIVVTGSYVIIGAKSSLGANPPIIVIFHASDISLYRELTLSSTSFVAVHQISSSSEFGYSVLGAVSSSTRRNLASGSGSTVDFAKCDILTENTLTLRLSCSTNECETSTGARMISLSSGKYFAGVTVNSGKSLFVEINEDFNTKVIYSTDIEASSLYIYSLSEPKEAPFIYALISQSEQGRSSSSGFSILIIDLNQHKIKAWSQNPFMAVSFAMKYGFIFIGGTNTDTNDGILLKTIPTDLHLLSESLKFTLNEYTMQAVEDTSYSLSTTTSTNISNKNEDKWHNDSEIAVNQVRHKDTDTEISSADSSEADPIKIFQFSKDELSASDLASPRRNLQLPSCTISHCEVCSSVLTNICIRCESGYTLNGISECLIESINNANNTANNTVNETAEGIIPDEPVQEALGTTTAAVTGTSTSSGVASAAISAGSRSSAWVMINQYQLLISTPTLETGMPDELLAFLDEFSFFTFNFEFLDSWKWPVSEGIVEEFDFPQPANGLKLIGYESGSIIVNQYNFSKVVVVVLLVHAVFVVLYCALKKKCQESWGFQKISEFLGKLFVFGAYVRIAIEGFLYVLINSLSEIRENATDIKEGFSYAVAIVVTVVCLSIPGLMLWHYLRYRNEEEFPKKSKFSEFYSGFKSGWLAKPYHLYFFIRRALSACIIVFLRPAPVLVRLILFDIVQLCGLLYAIIVRPYKHLRNNIMEILNETLFLIFCILITILNKEQDWSSSLANIVLIVIMTNGLIIALILLVTTVKDLVKFIRKCRKKRQEKKQQESKEISEEDRWHNVMEEGKSKEFGEEKKQDEDLRDEKESEPCKVVKGDGLDVFNHKNEIEMQNITKQSSHKTYKATEEDLNLPNSLNKASISPSISNPSNSNSANSENSENPSSSL